ncbi:unnamed protein product [Symbiodinium sp. CCMP2592]|nr:unnamed protein product [Symbiodinium sp. CCMP2592]
MSLRWDFPCSALSLGQRVNLVVQVPGEDGLCTGLWHGDAYVCHDLTRGIWTLIGYQEPPLQDAEPSWLLTVAVMPAILCSATTYQHCRATCLVRKQLRRFYEPTQELAASWLPARLPLRDGKVDCTALHNLLILAWLLQSDCILLECAVDLAACPEAHNLLKAFTEKAGLVASSVQLELAEQWASRRSRWWYVLVFLPQYSRRKVGLLNSLPASHAQVSNARAALCLTGNLTAPLQALWVYSQLKIWAACLPNSEVATPAADLVCQFKSLLKQSCLDTWDLPSWRVPGAIWIELEGSLTQVSIPGPTPVQELVEAEKALAGPGYKVQVLRNFLELPLGVLLRPNPRNSPYCVHISSKASQRDPTWQDAQALIGTSDITIWAGLLRLQAALPSAKCFVVPPRSATSLLDHPEHCDATFAWPPYADLCLLAFVDQAHWSLLVLTATEGGAEAAHLDGMPGRSTKAAQLLAARFCALCGTQLLGFQAGCNWQQKGPNDCGPITLAHATVALSGGTVTPSFLSDAQNFVKHMPFHKALLYGFGGLSEELQGQLQSTLLEKGVPQDKVKDRIKDAIVRLGPGPIASALAAGNVWQALKAAGSIPGAMFRWVRPEEVKALAESKASARFGAAVENPRQKKQKAKTKVARPALQVDPESLQLDPNCHGDCSCFHPAIEESVDRMILDAWGRSFSKVDGGRTAPEQADLFQVMIRVPCSALKLLHQATIAGFYFEPRAADGFSPHASYAVVWLPGKDKAQVQHVLRTCDKALAITRLGRRFGIRVKEADEKAVHATLKPEVDFIKLRISARFRLHPLPHGMQRSHLAKLLKEWKWPARPLQPARGDAAGSAWEVGLPLSALPAKLEDTCFAMSPIPLLVQPTLGQVKPGHAGNNLAQIRTELREDLQSLMQKQLAEHATPASESTSTATASQDARIQQLEVGVQELQMQNRKFEGWFQSFGTQLSESKAQVTDMQKAMQGQQADVAKLRGEVSSAVGSLKSDMNSRLDDQLQRIEALLSKKSRTESKEPLAVELGPGLWHFSESQLSAVTLRSCSGTLRSLAKARNRQVRITSGAPAALRPGSLWAGAWSGVLTMSDFPSRPLQLHWGPDAFATGRLQATFHCVGSLPLITANVYGYPAGPTFPDARHRTDQLLEILTREIVIGRSGARAIVGDFNHSPDVLNQVSSWRMHGWQEVQVLASERWGHTPTPTSKGAAFRDHIFVSPEAAALLTAVEVRDVFAEHSTVIASLSLDGVHQAQTWPLPSTIPWANIDIPAWQASAPASGASSSDATTWLKQFSKGFEASLELHSNGLPDARLPNRCHGRASRTKPLPSRMVAPPSASREGEEVIGHSLLSLEVKRWFQQLRRLQSLVHGLKAANLSPSAVEYRSALWHAITRAKGFRNGFSGWWQTRHIKLQGTPAALPREVPTLQIATLCFTDFRENYRRFEAWNARQRQSVLKERYEHDSNLLFRDLRDDSPEQVDCLVVHRTHTVLATEADTGQVQLDSDLDTRGSSEWRLDGQPVVISSPDQCVATISPSISVSVDAELEQIQYLSSVEDICHEFVCLWEPRWRKHHNLPPDHWHRVLNFAAAYLPTGHFDLQPLCLQSWKAAIKHFRPRAARGPDGYALADLQHMPDSLTTELLDFLSSIEAGAQVWPDQWLLGFVCGLKKPNNVQGAEGYRPIVLLSIVYRCWSGLRARQLLRHFKKIMPATALGFLPGRETTDFWWQLEALIELSCMEGTELCGFSTDIVKAFNALPREPIWRIAAQIGFPSSVLIPWRNFLGRFERRFLIRQCVSEPLLSTAGFPEGCALSTTAMNVACLIFHSYLEVFGRGITPHSYVDNWACTAGTAGQLALGVNLSHCVMDLLDLTPDDSKTYTWAVQSGSRKQLQALGLPTCTHARELGGVLSFGRATRNAALVERCHDTAELFARLRRSPAPLRQKLYALPRKVWARALHGISICPLSEAQVHSLRCSAVKALRVCPAGSSALLRLSIHSDLEADPGFYQLWVVIRDLRRMCAKHASVVDKWTSFMQGFSGRLQHGPFSKLLSVLNRIGWSVAKPPVAMDRHGGSVDLLSLPTLTLRRLLEQAWLDQVATDHRHRKQMLDLTGIDRALLRRSEKGLTPLRLAQLNALRSGAFLFDAAHSKYDVTLTGFCALCQVEDTPEHRVCHCPRFCEARTGVEWVCQMWNDLPVCTTHHLLAPASPFLPEVRQCLLECPDLSGNFASTATGPGIQHLFTDGSCIYPDLPELALASWGTVNASSGQIIGSGPVPGLAQTIPRAEMWAAICSLKWGLFCRVSVIVWSDSAYVVKGIRAILANTFVLPRENFDLWALIADLAAQYEHGTLQAQHVPSHIDVQACDSPLDEWLALWNDKADRLAAHANGNRGLKLAGAHQAAVSFYIEQSAILEALFLVYSRIADLTCARAKRPHNELEPELETVAPAAVPASGACLRFTDEIPLDWLHQVSLACQAFPRIEEKS